MNNSSVQARFAFFGTPALASEILDALENAGHVPAVVVTMPDKAHGRGMQLRETPVKAWPRTRNIPVLQPERLDAEFITNMEKHGCSRAIVVAYGKIFSQAVLDSFAGGMFNIHYSLLPRWRGATPVESAIRAGDHETGVTIQKIIRELDAGPVVGERRTKIGDTESAPELRSRLNGLAQELLVETMPALMEGSVSFIEQDESEATFCGKITKDDGLLDLDGDAAENYRKFRAHRGWPGSFVFFVRNGKKLRGIVTDARLENGKFVIRTIKPEGKGEIPYADFVRSGARPLSTDLH